MRTRLAALLVALTAAVGIVLPMSGAADAAGASPAPVAEGALVARSTTPEVATVFQGINDFRVQQGLRPLRFMPALHDIAQDWSDELGETDAFEHRDNLGSLYPPQPSGWGEVIALRTDARASAFVTQWMNSAPHRALLLGNFTHMGVGISLVEDYARYPSSTTMIGVTNFGRYATSTQPPSYASVEGWQQASGVTGLHDVVGQVDAVTRNADNSITVRGWAYDLSDPRASVSVSLWVKGGTAVRATANQPWAALAADGVPGNHGFSVTLPGDVGGLAEVCGLAANAVGSGAHESFACITRPELVRIPARDTMQASVDLSIDRNSVDAVTEVYLAPSHVYFEALTAAPAAARADRALLLVDPAGPSAALLAELRRLQPTQVTLVGAPDALPEATLQAVRSQLPSASVARVPGADVATISANFARQEFPGAQRGYLAAVGNLSDSISASSAAAASGVPFVVTPREDAMPAGVLDYFSQTRPAQVTIIGGSPQLSSAHERQIESVSAGTDAQRVRGADRFLTNVAALRTGWSGAQDAVFLASALRFGHAGIGSAIATADGPVVLTSIGCVPPAPHGYAANTVDPNRIVSLGETWTVSDYAASLGRCAS